MMQSSSGRGLVKKHSLDSGKENMLSLLIRLGKGYCILQIRPEGKVLSYQIAF